MSSVERARFYALVYLNAADIADRDLEGQAAKWSFWRPVAAITRAAEDGNPADGGDAAGRR